MNEIFGIRFQTPATAEVGLAKKELDELYDDCEGLHIYATKKTYRHEEEGFGNYNYKYVLEVREDCAGYGDNLEGEGFACLYMILCPDSISKKNLKSIADSCGIEEGDVTILDLFFDGLYAPIEDEGFEAADLDLDALTDAAAHAISTIDTLSGFYLDRPRNMIGTTGWDFIRHALYDENPYEAALKRYKERSGM
jgi:hypothetical protein